MPVAELMGPQLRTTLTTCLEECLLRLHRSEEQATRREARLEAMYTQWRKKWHDQRRQIAHRLTQIDAHLEALRPEEPAAPRFSLVHPPAESEGFDSLAG